MSFWSLSSLTTFFVTSGDFSFTNKLRIGPGGSPLLENHRLGPLGRGGRPALCCWTMVFCCPGVWLRVTMQTAQPRMALPCTERDTAVAVMAWINRISCCSGCSAYFFVLHWANDEAVVVASGSFVDHSYAVEDHPEEDDLSYYALDTSVTAPPPPLGPVLFRKLLAARFHFPEFHVFGWRRKRLLA